MRKRLLCLAALSLCLVIFFAGASLAKEYTAGGITVDMPENWNGGPQDADMAMSVGSPAEKMLLGFQIAPSEGASEQEIAEQAAQIMGFDKKNVMGLGRYAIRGNAQGVVYTISLFKHDGLLLTTHVLAPEGEEQKVAEVWKTARSSDPKTQALLKAAQDEVAQRN